MRVAPLVSSFPGSGIGSVESRVSTLHECLTHRDNSPCHADTKQTTSIHSGSQTWSIAYSFSSKRCRALQKGLGLLPLQVASTPKGDQMIGRVLTVSRLAALATAILVCGCQAPEAFHRLDGGVITGSGGTPGTGGILGTGGAGTGGRVGTGGSGTGGVGTGGSGTGGAGTGGSGTGGVGMGGSGLGGAGTGGRGTGGAAGTGTGGRSTGGSAGAGTGGAGGNTGTGPCMGLCNNPTVFTTQSYASGNLGIAATCHETIVNIQGGNCSNFPAPRTFSVNATLVPCNSNWTMPAKVRGGYCFQASAGLPAFAAFVTF